MSKSVIQISRFAEKQLRKIPAHIKEALLYWMNIVEIHGIREVRTLQGYHDEPLKGMREGQRSVRLNRAYRVIYEEGEDGLLTIITILEVNKHDY